MGDPWFPGKVWFRGRQKEFLKLPYARQEVEMIGQLINTQTLTGENATKMEVLKRLRNAALVHFAAHGDDTQGEIALYPNPTRSSVMPVEKDYLLTVEDVFKVRARLQLVVLSSCHSGRGKISADGVIGIARAFLAAGARSVVASLWSTRDPAIFEFMKVFYKHLVEGRRSSEALNEARKSLRKSDKFGGVEHWASFVLIGDDVTLEFLQKPCMVSK